MPILHRLAIGESRKGSGEMTREEAISWLNDMKNIAENWSQEVAIDMAIKALNEWTEYSDKLWKIAYERGKADALEQTEPSVIACDKIDEVDMLERMYDETTKTLTIPTDNSKMVAYTEIVKLSSPNITRWYYGYRPTEPTNALTKTETKEHDDLIIKNGKGIQDGLYNVNNGEIFKFKAKGGTVRAYKLVPSVSAERVGEWIERNDFVHKAWECSKCGRITSMLENYCCECGARMENVE